MRDTGYYPETTGETGRDDIPQNGQRRPASNAGEMDEEKCAHKNEREMQIKIKKTMAKVRFSAFIRSMSGTIERRQLSDGRIKTTYITKNGSLRSVITGKAIQREETPAQKEAKHRFGAISNAYNRICQRAKLNPSTGTREYFYGELKAMYYQLPKDRDREKDGETLCELFCGRFRQMSKLGN